MPKPFRPNKAATLETEQDFSRIRYPVYASPKYDGIRIVCHRELGPVTNTLKPIPNTYMRGVMSHPKLVGLDGEIICGDPTDPTGYSDTQSAFSSHGGEPEFRFFVFDDISSVAMQCSFPIRMEDVQNKTASAQWAFDELYAGKVFRPNIEVVQHTLIGNREELDAYCEQCVVTGFEGAMFRAHDKGYKFGRSTMIEGGLFKYKPFMDAEAVIKGFEPLMRNFNPPRVDSRGLQIRGYSQTNKVADEFMVGKVLATVINGQFKGCNISVGSGLDDTLRLQMKKFPEKFLDRTFTFKYQKFGSKDLPRSPIWKGLRHD